MKTQTLAMIRLIFKRYRNNLELVPSKILVHDIQEWLDRHDGTLDEDDKVAVNGILEAFQTWDKEGE